MYVCILINDVVNAAKASYIKDSLLRKSMTEPRVSLPKSMIIVIKYNQIPRKWSHNQTSKRPHSAFL